MMKIIHLFPAYKLGGAPVCILRFIENTNKTYQHHTIAKVEDLALLKSFQAINNVVCHDLDLTKFSVERVYKLNKIISQVKPDIVHVHGKGGAVYGLAIAIVTFKPFKLFYTFHGFYKKWAGFKWKLYILFENLFSNFYEKSIAVSESERQYILKTLRLNKSKVVTVYNGVYINAKNMPKHIETTLSKHPINIVTLSRFSHQKDLETMIKSFCEIRKEYSVGLHIFGGFLANDDMYNKKILKLIKEMDFENDIYLWGDYNDASSLLHHFDIYWSTAIFEGLPTAVIEAFLSETLVVGTDCRGNIDLIINEQTGLLSKTSNVKSNASAIIQAIEMIERNSHTHILNTALKKGLYYSIENNIKNIEALYSNGVIL